MQIRTESTALFPMLRYLFKDAKVIATTINRHPNYVHQRMSSTSGKTFTELEKKILLNELGLPPTEEKKALLFGNDYSKELLKKLLEV